MWAAEEPFGPVGASSAWLWIGIGLAAVALLALVWGFAPRPTGARRRIDVDDLRAAYLGRIDGLEAEYARGAFDDRTLHHRLSEVVRSFASDVSGVDARSMTPADLQAAGLTEVAGVVAGFWTPQFAQRSSTLNAEESLAHAREVVTRWT